MVAVVFSSSYARKENGRAEQKIFVFAVVFFSSYAWTENDRAEQKNFVFAEVFSPLYAEQKFVVCAVKVSVTIYTLKWDIPH